MEATLERNPNAFRPKIAASPHGVQNKRVRGLRHISVTFLIVEDFGEQNLGMLKLLDCLCRRNLVKLCC